MTRSGFALLLLSVPCAAALAAPGDVGGPPPSPGVPQERRVGEDVLGSTPNPSREEPQAVWIDGTVSNAAGVPIEGVLVKLFSNGLLRATARTTNDGKFAVEGNPPVGGNNTSVIWFQSPDPQRLLDSHVVLYAGNVARDRKLFPECVQRVSIAGSTASVQVTMLSEEERFAALEKSGCLGRR